MGKLGNASMYQYYTTHNISPILVTMDLFDYIHKYNLGMNGIFMKGNFAREIPVLLGREGDFM